jgi:hypothetical protein
MELSSNAPILQHVAPVFADVPMSFPILGPDADDCTRLDVEDSRGRVHTHRFTTANGRRLAEQQFRGRDVARGIRRITRKLEREAELDLRELS